MPKTLDEVIEIARQHTKDVGIAMRTSAMLCLTDAVRERCYEHYPEARQHALRSLAYSVGILHPDYKACAE